MTALVAMAVVAKLFVQPLHVPTEPISLLWALPICLNIAVVYKAIKLEEFTAKLFVREVALLFATIIGFLIVVALALAGIMWLAMQV